MYFKELLPDAACIKMSFSHRCKRRVLKCFIAIKMEQNWQFVQNREAEIGAGNPFRAPLLNFLAVSVCITVRKNGLEMRIWLGLRILLAQVAVWTSCSKITVFNILHSVVSLSNSFHRIPNNFFYELLATEEWRQDDPSKRWPNRQWNSNLVVFFVMILYRLVELSSDRFMLFYQTTRCWNPEDHNVRTCLKAFYDVRDKLLVYQLLYFPAETFAHKGHNNWNSWYLLFAEFQQANKWYKYEWQCIHINSGKRLAFLSTEHNILAVCQYLHGVCTKVYL